MVAPRVDTIYLSWKNELNFPKVLEFSSEMSWKNEQNCPGMSWNVLEFGQKKSVATMIVLNVVRKLYLRVYLRVHSNIFTLSLTLIWFPPS